MAFSVASDLVVFACRGDSVAIERLIEAVWPDAVRLATAIMGSRSAGEDVAQEACIALYRGIVALRVPEAFNVWFYRIVVREASSVKRRRFREERAHDGAPAIVDVGDSLTSIDVWQALATLPPGLRRVVVLHYFEDLSSAEIGKIMRKPAATVRFQLARAKCRLRPLLDETSCEARDTKEVRALAI